MLIATMTLFCIITFIHRVIIINNVHLFSGRFERLRRLLTGQSSWHQPMYIENVSLTTVSSNNYIVTSLASFLEEDSLLGVGSSIIHSHIIPHPMYSQLSSGLQMFILLTRLTCILTCSHDTSIILPQNDASTTNPYPGELSLACTPLYNSKW